ncbi:MAG: DUF4838 domain-containing protein [Flavobacteriaceae bacterium]|nr:DUF4838 domain-containing protein [Flavobacteriaceae bacterium]
MKQLIISFLIITTLSCSKKQINLDYKSLSEYTIVTENIAVADTLNVYLKKSLGIELPIKNDFQGNNKYIHLKYNSDILNDFISLSFSNNSITIQGNNSKMLSYGVYEFLERFVGVRWYSTDFTLVPEISSINIPLDKEIIYKPLVTTRTVHSRLFYNDSSFADKLKVSNEAFPNYVPNARVHTFHRFIPYEKFYDDHPEYYAFRNGKRLATQLCLTNENVLEIVKDSVASFFKKYDLSTVISVSQDDNTQYCMCDNCSEIHDREGSPAGSMIYFVNQIAKSFPDKTISTLAYQYTRKPPLTKPESNVLITLCSIECDRSIPIDEGCKDFQSDLIGWSKLTENIRIWDYTTQFTNFLAPFPNWGTIKPNINLFVNNNAKWIFEQHSNNPSELFELRSYLMAKLLWDPNLDSNLVIKDFTNGYYGQGGIYIAKYIEEIQNQLNNAKPFFLFLYGDPSQAFDGYLSPKNLSYYDSLLDEALLSVSKDSDYYKRIERSRLSIDYAILEAYRKNFSKQYPLKFINDEVTMINPKVIDRLTKFYNIASLNDITLMNEMGFTVSEYVSNYKKALSLASKNNIASFKKVTLLSNPKKYANEDPQVLTDGALGGNSFYSNWLGFEGNDLDAIIDLDSTQFINNISLNFLQVTNHIVFYPLNVQFEISNDSVNWKSFPIISNKLKLNPKSKVNDIQTFSQVVNNEKAHYIRVKAKNIKKAPFWHHGADLPSWIFADELIVE